MGPSFYSTLPLDGQQWLKALERGLQDPITLLDSLEGGYLLGFALAAALPVLRLTLDTAISKPLGRRLLPQGGKTTAKSHHAGLSTRLYKWQESFWKATIYTVFFSIALRGSIKERFFYDTRYFWLGCTQFPPCNYDVPRLVRLLYAAEFAYYFQGVPYLILFEVKRKDFWENVCHHAATLGLIIYSYQLNFMKVGTMMFLCHDVTDILMETAKLFGYMKRHATSTAVFVVFMLTWIAARLVYFPFFIIRSVWSEPIEIVAKVYNLDPHPHHEIFLTLLSILFALHLYWTVLITKVAITAIMGDITDVREEGHAGEEVAAQAVESVETLKQS